MTHDVVIPQLGLMEDAEIVGWHRGDGDRVARGEPLVSIQTDKVEVDVESPADGILRVMVEAGPERVAADTILGTVTEEA